MKLISVSNVASKLLNFKIKNKYKVPTLFNRL